VSGPAAQEAARDARILVGEVAALALVWVAACVALALDGLPELAQVAALILAAATVPAAIRRIRGPARAPGRSPLAGTPGAAAAPPVLDAEIARIRRALETGETESRRLLREAAAGRLIARGVEISDHEAARTALGDDVWEALWGEPPEVVEPRRAQEIVAALERLD